MRRGSHSVQAGGVDRVSNSPLPSKALDSYRGGPMTGPTAAAPPKNLVKMPGSENKTPERLTR